MMSIVLSHVWPKMEGAWCSTFRTSSNDAAGQSTRGGESCLSTVYACPAEGATRIVSDEVSTLFLTEAPDSLEAPGLPEAESGSVEAAESVEVSPASAAAVAASACAFSNGLPVLSFHLSGPIAGILEEAIGLSETN